MKKIPYCFLIVAVLYFSVSSVYAATAAAIEKTETILHTQPSLGADRSTVTSNDKSAQSDIQKINPEPTKNIQKVETEVKNNIKAVEKSDNTNLNANSNGSNDKKKASDNDKTKNSDSNKSSSDSKSSSAKNPFAEDTNVKVIAKAEPAKIADIDVAKACGINEIKKGFPKAGKVAAVGSDYLRLRSWPWGNVIGTFYAGTELEVLGESGEFYLVSINGKQGYMHKNYVSTDDKAASGTAPYYPGDTASGGALSLKEGVQASKDGAAGKVPSAPSGSSTPGSVTISGNKIDMNVPKKNQYQANVPAPGSACGPTSLAMVLGYCGKGDPSVLVSDLWYVCGATAANGTGHAGLVAGAKKYGLSNAKFYYSVGQEWCRGQLKAGKPLICHVKGHYVVMRGMDSNGNVILNDPAWRGVERTMSWSAFSSWWAGSNAPYSCMSF